MQSSNLIEISPQPEGRVYTRCFCLEEPLGAVSSRIPPAAWYRSPSRHTMLPTPQGGQRSAAVLGAWCCRAFSHVDSSCGKALPQIFHRSRLGARGGRELAAVRRRGAREGRDPVVPLLLCAG